MIAAELIRRATEAGIKMAVGPDGRLLLRAERQPPADLLADLAAHKGELLVELAAANDLLSSSVWLARVERLLGARPAVLQEGGHLELHDLIELAGTDAAMVADTIRRSPAWINRPQRAEQAVERFIVEEEVEPQRTVHTAATASPAWREADAAYTNHLMSCHACHAATGRHCEVGADLRQRYRDTPTD